jgi:hypothetical protein
VNFKEGNTQTSIGFKNVGQLKLFRYFYETLEVKGTRLTLPEKAEDCDKIRTILENDYKNFSSQIKSLLKSFRSNASFLALYRDLVLSAEKQ